MRGQYLTSGFCTMATLTGFEDWRRRLTSFTRRSLGKRSLRIYRGGQREGKVGLCCVVSGTS